MQILFEEEKSSLVEQHKRDEKALSEIEERLQLIRRREQELKDEHAEVKFYILLTWIRWKETIWVKISSPILLILYCVIFCLLKNISYQSLKSRKYLFTKNRYIHFFMPDLIWVKTEIKFHLFWTSLNCLASSMFIMLLIQHVNCRGSWFCPPTETYHCISFPWWSLHIM